jgi:hypothetical protein
VPEKDPSTADQRDPISAYYIGEWIQIDRRRNVPGIKMTRKTKKGSILSAATEAIARGRLWPNGCERAHLSDGCHSLFPIYQIDPLRNARWQGLLERNPTASVFHREGWLQALRRTYGYEPIVFTTSQIGATLTNGLLSARIVTGLAVACCLPAVLRS